MTAAPPDTALELVYADATSRARRLVASRYPLRACPPGHEDYPPGGDWREVWDVEVGEDAVEPDRLLLALPRTFPDAFPRAYLPVDAATSTGPLPHVDENRFLCTFDPTEAHCNADEPGGIALAVIERAAAEYRRGTDGDNATEFADEFAAYWANGGIGALAVSLVAPSERTAPITVIALSPPWRRARWLFSKTQAQGERWLKNVGYLGKPRARRSLYVPLVGLGSPPYPMTNAALWERLGTHDPTGRARVAEFLQADPRPSRVLASVPAPGGRVLIAWEHQPLARHVAGAKGHRKIAGPIPGFRADYQPIAYEMLGVGAAIAVARASVTEVGKDRLWRRTAGTAVSAMGAPWNVVGCGSLGGFLAEGIVRSGRADRLRLIDGQLLQAENTPRHLCGMDMVGMPKAGAVALAVERRFPHVRCEPHTADVLELVRMGQPLSPAALTVIALGDISAERRINRLLRTPGGGIGYPVCFVWAEPHLYAGHAVYLGGDLGCLECLFDEEMRFVGRVLSDPGAFSRREAGCQSTYVPYSGMDTVSFASACVRFIASCVGETGNRVFTWTGDMDAARASGISLESGFRNAGSFAASVIPLVHRAGCPVCGQ